MAMKWDLQQQLEIKSFFLSHSAYDSRKGDNGALKSYELFCTQKTEQCKSLSSSKKTTENANKLTIH